MLCCRLFVQKSSCLLAVVGPVLSHPFHSQLILRWGLQYGGIEIRTVRVSTVSSMSFDGSQYPKGGGGRVLVGVGGC